MGSSMVRINDRLSLLQTQMRVEMPPVPATAPVLTHRLRAVSAGLCLQAW
jgi:hypothetical protein